MLAFANCHSHVFHRALRGRVGGDSFWSWRDEMYAIAAVLDPDLLHRLARATYAEMRLAGIGVVGEFHYLHHQSDGTPYDDANVMGEALIEAAREVGLRICLLDTCYTLAEGVQRRFDDGDAGETHLGVRGAGQPVQQVGVEHGGQGVHVVAPRPERVAGRPSAQRTMEHVAVAVREGLHQSSRS